MCQPGNNKPSDTPSGAGPSQAQVHMEDDNLFDLKPNVPVSIYIELFHMIIKVQVTVYCCKIILKIV